MKDGMLPVEHIHQLSILNKGYRRGNLIMNHRQMVRLEPFAEITGGAYRFGYRAIETDDCLSAVDIPTSIVEQAVLTRASLTTQIGPDGTVISHMLISHVGDGIPDIPTDVASIEVLIRRALNAENLRREEATVEDLRTLLQRLENCARLVRGAISQMTSDQHPASGTV
jgi:hypothetical protein